MKVQIAFQHGDSSLVGKAIQIWTSAKGSLKDGSWRTTAYHVELSFDGVTWYGAIAEENVYRRKAMTLNPDDWRVYELEVIGDEFRAMYDIANDMIGKKYDWINILGSDILDLYLENKEKYTCDEAVALILKSSKYRAMLSNISRLNPHQLEQKVKGMK